MGPFIGKTNCNQLLTDMRLDNITPAMHQIISISNYIGPFENLSHLPPNPLLSVKNLFDSTSQNIYLYL